MHPLFLSRRGAVAARRAHNPKVGGSNPPAATTNQTTAPVSDSLGRWFFHATLDIPGHGQAITIVWQPLRMLRRAISPGEGAEKRSRGSNLKPLRALPLATTITARSFGQCRGRIATRS